MITIVMKTMFLGIGHRIQMGIAEIRFFTDFLQKWSKTVFPR